MCPVWVGDRDITVVDGPPSLGRCELVMGIQKEIRRAEHGWVPHLAMSE